MSRWELSNIILAIHWAYLINNMDQHIDHNLSLNMHLTQSNNIQGHKKQLFPALVLNTLVLRLLNLCPLFVPSPGAWGRLLKCPPLLARLYFFISPSGGCQSPRGCQSTLILIRTWVLSGVNGSQQLSTSFLQSYCNSYITHCMCRRMHTYVHIRTQTCI